MTKGISQKVTSKILLNSLSFQIREGNPISAFETEVSATFTKLFSPTLTPLSPAPSTFTRKVDANEIRIPKAATNNI